MKTHNHAQGSDAWHAHRAQCFNASDAGPMLGISPYRTRADLLREYSTSLRAEVDAGTQRRFDDGHRFEALARPLAEKIVNDDLAPVVGSEDFGFSRPLGASFDGITMMGDTCFEHKTLNDELRVALSGKDAGLHLPNHYRAQMEQQLLVSGATRVLFMATKWDGTDCVESMHCWYESDKELRKQLLRGWKQFDADLAAYVPGEATTTTVATPIEALPSVSVRMDGSLAVHSNLDVFGQKLREFIKKIPTKPASDQDFADCDAACKALKRAEDALDGAKANALGQVQSVEELTRSIDDLRESARTTRLATEKLVKARKEQIRLEEVQRGKRALDAHVHGLNEQVGGPYMPAIAADFGAAISGLKTFDSVRAKVDQLLADKKIEANEIAGAITLNLRTVKAHGDYEFLFPDLRAIVTKTPEDFQALVQNRVRDHQAEEQRREEATRERIRQEELAKLQKEQQAAPAAAAIAPMRAANDAPANKVVPMSQPATRGKPTLRLGEINERIAPLAITEAGLAKLGYAAITRERSACLYHEDDFAAMCDAIVAHVSRAKARQLEAEAA